MTLKRLGTLAILALLAGCAGSGPPSGTMSGNGTEGGSANGNGSSVAANNLPGGSEEDLARNVGDRVYFAFDKIALSSDAQATLDRQAAWLQANPTVRVQIAGNCDERGTEEYNIALGQRRANTARDYLVAKGAAASRITTVSFGKERPQPDATCNDESCWAKNRNAITSVQ